MPQPPHRGTLSIDPDMRAWAEQTNKVLEDLTGTVRLLLALTEKSLIIQVKQAHLLERVANVVLDVEDPEAITPERAEVLFRELRALFEEQRKIMTENDDGESR